MRKEEKEKKEKGSSLPYILGGLAAAGIGAGLCYLFTRNKGETKGNEEDTKKEDFNWKYKKPTRKEGFEIDFDYDPDDTEVRAYICPITNEIMEDPVITPSGISYEREAIEAWLMNHDTDPMTKKKLSKDQLIPNFALKNSIDDYIKKKKAEHK